MYSKLGLLACIFPNMLTNTVVADLYVTPCDALLGAAGALSRCVRNDVRKGVREGCRVGVRNDIRKGVRTGVRTGV